MTSTQSQDRAQAEIGRVRSRVLVLERRIDDLESLLLRGLVLATVVLLGVGSLVTAAAGPDVGAWSVLTAPIGVYDTLANSDNVPATLVLLLAAVALLVVVLVALGACGVIWRRHGGGAARFVRVVGWLLPAAITVVLILTLIAGAEPAENAEAGSAVRWLVPGAVLFALMVHSDGLRRLWVADS
ncbi:hypothetical protein [Pseudactinotalea sp. Z1732]|uniref:hypothetical protein n=1 Tax=Micrococcales TaxID=85006 RepID=UPI003C7BB49E